MRVSDLLKRSGGCILNPLQAADKTDAITQLVNALAAADRLLNPSDVLCAVLARESTRSTGIGNGLAVPHGKSTGCDRLVLAMGKADPAIDFGSGDGKPCHLIVLVASPTDETGPHIQALASMARLWSSATP